MTQQAQVNTLRRKAGAGRPAPEIGRMTTTRALRKAIAQAAEDAVALTATATRVDESRSSLTAFVGLLPDNALIIRCKTEQDQYGVVVLDLQSLAALIEVQTTGRVVPNPARPRDPTRTDALLAAGVIDEILKVFETMVAEAGLSVVNAISGYRYEIPLADARSIELGLADVPYRLFQADVSFGDGAKDGKILILLPYDGLAAHAGASPSKWQDDLQAVVQCASVEMEAILARKKLPLRAVSEFQVGTLIPLPRDVVTQIRLEDMNGQIVTRGRLGQAAGNRAIRLTHPCDMDVPGQDDAAAGTDTNPAPPPPLGLGETATQIPNDVGDDLPTVDDLNQAADLPDLPDLPDLSDLPDLAGLGDDSAPGLPDLPMP
ncbi:MAG TPA: flagellar motor switch protein FliM [Aliiroseovarius sp.]|nr:flagellar motor switch protein FliM [Aliiroseovarius sp.]